jgi:hypothetical protein
MTGSGGSGTGGSEPPDAPMEAAVSCKELGGNATGLDCRCDDATVDQEFTSTMVGCADSSALGTSWAQRARLCGPACHVCTSVEWLTGQPGGTFSTPPKYNYWTDDNLQQSGGTAPGNCAVKIWSGAVGSEPCPGQPMHVCVGAATEPGKVTDPVGSTCDLHDCGFEDTNDAYFGGCATNRTAGTLCCCP